MKWNRQEVETLLDAKIEEDTVGDGNPIFRVRFEDRVMKYELLIIPHMESVFLAADPVRPMQGLPFFETSLPCKELAPFSRSGMPTGLGIYAGAAGPSTRKFSITRRQDGSISLSGAWGDPASS